MSDDRRSFTVNTPESMRALQLLVEAATGYGVRGGSFHNGDVTFYGPSGPWTVPSYRQSIKGWDWDIVPVPGGPGGRGTTLGSDAYYIATASKHPNEAWES